ncbi:MAG: nucleotidyltransferase family protein [Myxococcota bacterium]
MNPVAPTVASAHAIDELLAASLAGRSADWPRAAPPDFEEAFLERVRFHRTHVLLYAQGVSGSRSAGWPDSVRGRIAELARAEIVGEMLRSRELARVLGALADVGVESLLLKGAALAHTTYRSPALRPRVDTDLLVRDAHRERAERTLVKLGYARATRIAGSLIEYQAPYFRDGPHGIRSVLDLHWRVSNRQVLASEFPFDELAACSVAVPQLGSAARALAAADAILVAAVHGPAHHRGQERPLIWLYDVHLLASALGARDWEILVERAARRGLRRLCESALVEASDRLGTRLPARALAALRTDAVERAARLLDPGAADLFWQDVAAIGSWRKRLRFLVEAAFPSPAYLRARYALRSSLALPFAYLVRGVVGLARRRRRP